jgi:hypothetical protein
MATRTEDRFGEATGLGTTYTLLGTVPASTTWNLLVNVTNRTAGVVKLRLYVADTSWTTGEPTGGTLKAAIAYDTPIAVGDVWYDSGVVMKTTEKLVARSDTAASLDILVSGVAHT